MSTTYEPRPEPISTDSRRPGRGLRRRRVLAGTAVLALASFALGACGGDSAGSGTSGGDQASGSQEVDVVGFAVIKSAYDALGEGFEKTPEGEGVTFKGSYGASGAQSRAVIAGQKADLVALSLTPDVDNIAEAGKIDPSWSTGPTKGIVSSLGRRPRLPQGQPEGHHGLGRHRQARRRHRDAGPGHLGRRQVEPARAPTARRSARPRTRRPAQAYLQTFVKNVVSWNDSGRTATEAFVKGTGDVLISYENEAIAARAAGVELEYVVPDSTFLIQNPAAVTKDGAAGGQGVPRPTCSSQDGQAILGSKGFRPIDGSPGTVKDVEGANDPANPFPAVTQARHRRRPRRLVRGERRVLRQGATASSPSSGHGLDRWPRTDERPSTGGPRARAARRARGAPGSGGLTPASGLGLGVGMLWLSLIVLLPIAAIVVTSFEGGLATFWANVTSDEALSTMRLTVGAAAAGHARERRVRAR